MKHLLERNINCSNCKKRISLTHIAKNGKDLCPFCKSIINLENNNQFSTIKEIFIILMYSLIFFIPLKFLINLNFSSSIGFCLIIGFIVDLLNAINKNIISINKENDFISHK